MMFPKMLQFTKFMYFCNRISKKINDEKDIIRWNIRFADVYFVLRATRKRRFSD